MSERYPETKVSKADQTRADRLYDQALDLMNLGRLAAAEKPLRESFRLRPERAGAGFELANLLISLHKYEELFPILEYQLPVLRSWGGGLGHEDTLCAQHALAHLGMGQPRFALNLMQIYLKLKPDYSDDGTQASSCLMALNMAMLLGYTKARDEFLGLMHKLVVSKRRNLYRTPFLDEICDGDNWRKRAYKPSILQLEREEHRYEWEVCKLIREFSIKHDKGCVPKLRKLSEPTRDESWSWSQRLLLSTFFHNWARYKPDWI